MWPFSRKKQEQTILDLPPSGDYSTEIVGESFHDKNLKKICGGRTKDGHHKETKAILQCENDNKHDKNAVCVRIDGLIVGHLSRNDAKAHRKTLQDQGIPETPVRCSALITGGWSRKLGTDKGNFGVTLDLGED